MTSQDKISIGITFLFGLFVGSYLYVTGFAITFNIPETALEDVYSGLLITGEGYGECEQSNTCLTFQVLENGDYRALFAANGDNDPIVKEGSISRALRNSLGSSLTAESLTLNSKIRSTPDCKYGLNDTNYRFRITLDKQEYLLDTCQTKIDYNGSAWTSLTKLWNYFATLEL